MQLLRHVEPVTRMGRAPSPRWNAAPPFTGKGSAFTIAPSLTDGNVSMDEQVNFMVSRYGGAATAHGAKIYGLDNEPDLWSPPELCI